LGFALALFLIHRFDAALRPQLVSIAEAQIRNQFVLIADQAITDVLTENDLSYGDLVTFHTGETGQITALSTDTVLLNLLRSAIFEDISQQVDNLDSRSLGVPFGSLTGIDLLSAWGPRLSVQVLSVASVEGDYRNEFTDAGINQTLHRILLDVTMTARLLLPGGIQEITVSAPVCVAETVIIGQVPQTYLNYTQ
jgi:sporulation protein YunB